ncbi:MAG: 1,4-alpha-glucan branching protein GlgB, partial [Actinomycetota bacterium]
KFHVTTAAGEVLFKSDPFAFAAERPPETASIVFESRFEWSDQDWMEQRQARDPLRVPFSIYECHIGSWKKNLSYREIAHELSDYVTKLGFTHIEFLPIAEHPFRGSWGYQVSAYFAPSSRFGDPDDFRYLVNHMHRCGIGVIADWVPAHFPKDDFALARFDGDPLYEHSDPRVAEQPDWGTLTFDFGRPEVRNFLVANALWWIEEFHLDGLRVDAVSSMLYLNFSREPGEWAPNVHGGSEDLEAVSLLKELNTIVYARNPSVLMIGEESTAWPGVSRPVYMGGLGFGAKWNLGWMHDTLKYLKTPPQDRAREQRRLTFGPLYQWDENFVLPLSHDEVVHGKGSLFGKMPAANAIIHLRALFAWMWAHPGRPLLFMGGEFGQIREWSHDRELDWELLGKSDHLQLQDLVSLLNQLRNRHRAFWELDFDKDGFEWFDADEDGRGCFSFRRYSADRAETVLCTANFSAESHKVALPPGEWKVLMDTMAAKTWGTRDDEIDLSPSNVVWLVPIP